MECFQELDQLLCWSAGLFQAAGANWIPETVQHQFLEAPESLLKECAANLWSHGRHVIGGRDVCNVVFLDE